MSATKIEFAVQMTCDSCVEAVEKALKATPNIKSYDINLANGSVVVESILPTLEVQKRIETSGRKVVIKGYAGSIAGVSILDAGQPNVQGVVRFVQVTPEACIIDGTIDGLAPGDYRIAIHECGDLSQGCKSVGNVFNPRNGNDESKNYGGLGTIIAEENGRASFRFENNKVELSRVIGRSFVVSEKSEENKVVCGIIARSAGLFQNPKMICACDGISIWDETVNPQLKAKQ